MKELKVLETSSNVKKVVDNSDYARGLSRVRVFFKNGHELSIIRGLGTYGGDEGLFEIMPSDPKMLNSQVAADEYPDEVEGYLTFEQVNAYIKKIGEAKS